MRREAIYEACTGSSRDFVHVFHHLRGITLQRAWVGIDGHPPDEVMCIGTVPEVPGFLLGGPGSGHGFGLGPVVGKLLAELITTGKTSIPIDGLSMERFRVRRPEAGATRVCKDSLS
jgi:sarcosine oxidase subunit beta